MEDKVNLLEEYDDMITKLFDVQYSLAFIGDSIKSDCYDHNINHLLSILSIIAIRLEDIVHEYMAIQQELTELLF